MAPNMRPFAAANLLSQAGRRAFTTQRPSPLASKAQWTSRPVQHQIALRQSIRRASSDTIPPKVKRGGFRILRWTWRLTYLSAIAGLGYVGYGIYEMRNPEDQPDPHPSKKTLVVLGE
jgi:NADH:ubiquinone reductase (non-electrogenic)